MRSQTTETLLGRPLDETVTKSILQSTIALLQEIGFDDISIALVAKRAGCGRGAVYRRWKGKTELIVDAFGHRPVPHIELSGSPEQNLSAAIDAAIDEFAEHKVYMSGFVSAMREHPELKARYQSAMVQPMLDLLMRQIVSIIGEEHAALPLLAETVPGVLLHRLLISGVPIDRDAINESFLLVVRTLASKRPKINQPTSSKGL